MKRISFIFYLLLICMGNSYAEPVCNKAAIRAADHWGSADKKLHFGVSFIAGMASRDIFKLDTPTQAFVVAMIPGLVKEVIDATDSCNVFSTKDLAVDAIGALVGIQVRGFFITPNSISYSTTF